MYLIKKALLVCMLFFPVISQASPHLGRADFDRICGETTQQKNAEEVTLCEIYTIGFIDGAVSTDPRVVENLVKEVERSDFTARALRTRTGLKMKSQGYSVYANFCIDSSVQAADITAHVKKSLDKQKGLSGNIPREIVFDVLQTSYPCQ
ncbi:MAG: hypothetical protein ACI9JR_002449 [Gammaproteobacteria bacterium]|jgi:hypothetical protein